MKPDLNEINELVKRHLPSASKEAIEVDSARVVRRLRTNTARANDHAFQKSFLVFRPLSLFGWKFTVAAAVVVLGVFIGAIAWRESLTFAIAVNSDGGLYRVVEGKTQAIVAGERIVRGETITSNGGSGASLILKDGSRIEIRSKSELWFDRAEDGVRIHLRHGSVIVSAAKQGKGHLYVQTNDVMVSVVGTVFLVNAEAEGSRVAVIEGEVRVEHGMTKQKLLPGEQVSTAASMESLSVKEELTWSSNAEEHLALLQQSVTSTRQEPGRLRPAFEVASVRPSRNVLPQGGAGRGGFLEGCSGNPLELDPGRFTALNTTLPTMISLAYREIRLSNVDTRDCVTLNALNLLSGGPDWIKSVESGQFDIQAVIPAGTPRYELSDLLGGNAPELQQMLQTLLEDRFKLVLRRETKELPVYFLSVAKSGPKFNGSRKELSSDGRPRVRITEDDAGNLVRTTEPPRGIRFGRSQDQNGSTYIRLDASRTPMSELVLALHRPSGRLVIDRTGLTGEYSFYLDYAENGVARPPVTSVLEEIGLELKDGRAPVEVWVIDHAEQPSEN